MSMEPYTSGSNFYLEVSFSASAGTLAGNDDSGTIKLRINKSDWSDFDESDDYSFNSSIGSFTSYDKITLYQNGVLVWGTEPGSGSRSVNGTDTSDEMEHAFAVQRPSVSTLL